MYENKSYKKNNCAKLTIISVFIAAMFIVGFVSGASYIYGSSSSEIQDLQSQINNFKTDNDNNKTTYISTYYYNETSLSDIYKNVKDSIVVISGIALSI